MTGVQTCALPIFVLGGTIEDRKDVGIFPRTKKWSIWRLAVGFVTIPLAILFFGLYTKVLTQRINLPWPLSTLAVPVEIIITFSWAPLLAVAIFVLTSDKLRQFSDVPLFS